MDHATRFATTNDAEAIIDLSKRVQAALIATGSLQEVGPLDEESVNDAIEKQRSFVLDTPDISYERCIIGCAFFKPVGQDCFVTTSTFTMNDYQKPLLFLYWVMLEPSQGIGSSFIEEVLNGMRSNGHNNGTPLLLDCWAGNTKLRTFYTHLDLTFAAIVPQEDYEIGVFYLDLADLHGS
ncbi:hypothetical protein CLAFUW4_03180 [Fulvia fulva]|uniref:Uncharacterized protein n=1 Tax=Passalora fulva TaxID=5499 RepID=A0A9Q8L8X1_PASFU|nr:uncharacterized protein CLAFUR5_03164 [Fulvia fulva]KAK4631558.1 hypothetical protein CLAFUR4_03169 [Fulvia fulva]KAK4632426.1 hypothetical protein CLAFUR0_03173 [Fulvia fulva]UJO13085.1 hypothetical protein CLAFUR5_03164 [Fulvia fulva]WPV11344.1 hypothetical protein CLAFUW4_03180 [Fulvia fulva]WPV26068.1 hypothetical protein CLAFUW7_03173 [Fulvia fulva]